MIPRKQYSFSSLIPSSVVFNEADDESRMHVFTCMCGGNDHAIAAFYVHTNEDDPNYVSLFIEQNIRSTWWKRRWKKAYRYITGKGVQIGMGDGTCLSAHSIEKLIEVIRSFVNFMEDNFSKEELDKIGKTGMFVRKVEEKGESKIFRYGKMIRKEPYTDITLVFDSTDDSAPLTSRDSRYLFTLGFWMDNSGWHNWEASWTLSTDVGFFQKLWWTMRYLTGSESRYSRQGILELKYHDAIMVLLHLEKFLGVQKDFLNKTHVTELSKQDFNQVVDLINSPPEPNEVLKKSAQNYKDSGTKSDA